MKHVRILLSLAIIGSHVGSVKAAQISAEHFGDKHEDDSAAESAGYWSRYLRDLAESMAPMSLSSSVPSQFPSIEPSVSFEPTSDPSSVPSEESLDLPPSLSPLVNSSVPSSVPSSPITSSAPSSDSSAYPSTRPSEMITTAPTPSDTSPTPVVVESVEPTSAPVPFSPIPSDVEKEITIKGIIEITNLAPIAGTWQTPVWCGIHDGTFDIYDINEAASNAVEKLAEDGNNVPLHEEFESSPGGSWDGTAGVEPIGPNTTVELTFEFSYFPGKSLYFSFASMVIPSNDAWIANGNPMLHELVNQEGVSLPLEFTVLGNQVLDAGTEVNDEVPEHTAFFGQTKPDAGLSEGGVVRFHAGYINPPETGNILDDEEFSNADFTVDGYQMIMIKVGFEEPDGTAKPGLGN